MGHKGLIQMGPMGCDQGPMGLTRWGPWAPWAAQGCLNTTPSIRRALALQKPIDYLMDTHKHTFPTLRVIQPLPQLIGKYQRTPWPPWTSLESAPSITWDSSKWVPCGAVKGPWGSSDGGHGSHGPPKDA